MFFFFFSFFSILFVSNLNKTKTKKTNSSKNTLHEPNTIHTMNKQKMICTNTHIPWTKSQTKPNCYEKCIKKKLNYGRAASFGIISTQGKPIKPNCNDAKKRLNKSKRNLSLQAILNFHLFIFFTLFGFSVFFFYWVFVVEKFLESIFLCIWFVCLVFCSPFRLFFIYFSHLFVSLALVFLTSLFSFWTC